MTKKTYTKEFKIGAARMVVDEKVRPAKVARDLGVSSGALTKWTQDYQKHGSGAFPGKGLLSPVDDEMNRLRKDVRRLTMERDILKKTIALFAELDRKGTER
jgi:transposase